MNPDPHAEFRIQAYTLYPKTLENFKILTFKSIFFEGMCRVASVIWSKVEQK
jgi:hypothetical protein